MIVKEISNKSALDIVELERKLLCFNTFNFKGYLFTCWVRVRIHRYTFYVNLPGFGNDYKAVERTNRVKGRVRKTRRFEIKVDGGAVEDNGLAGQIGFLRHAELYKAFTRAAIWWQIDVFKGELHYAAAIHLKMIRMAACTRVYSGWVKCSRQGIANDDLMHRIGACIPELD